MITKQMVVTDSAGVVHAVATGPGLLCKTRTVSEESGVGYNIRGRRVYSGIIGRWSSEQLHPGDSARVNCSPCKIADGQVPA